MKGELLYRSSRLSFLFPCKKEKKKEERDSWNAAGGIAWSRFHLQSAFFFFLFFSSSSPSHFFFFFFYVSLTTSAIFILFVCFNFRLGFAFIFRVITFCFVFFKFTYLRNRGGVGCRNRPAIDRGHWSHFWAEFSMMTPHHQSYNDNQNFF